jgi:hypothetical protein
MAAVGYITGGSMTGNGVMLTVLLVLLLVWVVDLAAVGALSF